MKQLFKPGDKVQLKTGGPVMEVVKYVLRNNFLYAQHLNTGFVECSYYNFLKKDWEKEIFHQDNLVKVNSAKPAWVENLRILFGARPAVLFN